MTKQNTLKNTTKIPKKNIKTSEKNIISKENFKININLKKDDRLSNFGKAVLKDRYLMPNENFQELFARVASYYADDQAHANRIYGYISLRDQ